MHLSRVRLDKVKRPGGVFSFEMDVVEDADDTVWLRYPKGYRWRAPHDTGVMPFEALLLIRTNPPSVTWWVDDPDDRRVEIDICLEPVRTDAGWSFIDLELDPVRHERSGHIEIEDHDEFVAACNDGWITTEEADLARQRAAEMEQILRDRVEPWGESGWQLLARLAE